MAVAWTASSTSATRTRWRCSTASRAVRRRQPRRLLRRRPVLPRHLRVLRRAAQGRHRDDEGDLGAAADDAARPHGADAAGREALPRRRDLLRRRHDARRRVGGRRPTLRRSAGSCPPARARTASTSPATPSTCSSPTADEGSISVLDFATDRLVDRSGASPAAAAPTWAACPPTARCSGCPAATTARCTPSPRDGQLLARIQVGSGPHGLCVYPQPGRYSLGHTGVFR